MSNHIKKLIKNSKNPKFIEEVFEFSKEAYGDKKRPSGESYLDHAVSVATILDQMHLDQTTIAAGLLHDVTDTTSLSPEKKVDVKEIEKKFGKEISLIVKRTSDIKKIYYPFYGNKDVNVTSPFSREKVENIRKMFLAIATDLRVVLIELASRIDGLHNIAKLPTQQQTLYATETMEIFAPMANRLGLWEVKSQLEDLAFAYLFPEKFTWMQNNIKEKYEQRQKYLKKFIPHLKRILIQERVKFSTIDYRAKSYWSTYVKLLKKDMDLERIHDLVALRVIVSDVQACYKTLGILHKHYKPISGEIDDYIAKPKPNGYKSLHTTVYLEKDRISEIQIRTEEMHKEAEYGVCAHWSYKEKINLQKEGDTFSWTSKIPEFWQTFKIDFFANQIFVFTPRGDIIPLPKGSTPVDFAYAIHSEIGNHCDSAKVGGKIIPLTEHLKSGDIVEIITNKKRKPSQDWLKFVKTDFAKNHIKKFNEVKISPSIFSIPSFIKKKIVEISEKAIAYRKAGKKIRAEKKQIKKEKLGQIYLAGQKGIMVTIAKCCLPQPNDHAKAYLTRYRAAVLHKTSCQNLQKLSQKFPEKIIDASWK